MKTPTSRDQPARYQQFKKKFAAVAWITLFWLILALYQYTDRYSVMVEQQCMDDAYVHWPYLRGLFMSVALAGALGGTGLVFLWENWLRKMAFLRVISYIVVWYVGTYALITYLATILYALYDPSILVDQSALKTLITILLNIHALPNFLFWLFAVLLTLFFLLIKDKFGPSMFFKFLSGIYFRPKREERIFMFMDLQSATTIAEELGEERYFNLLNDSFKTTTPGIMATQGEIYQYVGDEIVINWKKEEGLKKANCIRCFFAMSQLLESRSDYFQTNYGFVPKFKAGLHGGFVITGEMGIIKREIVYSGDVLNTTSRIQGQCNKFGTNLLISRTLMEQLDSDELGLTPRSLGGLDLKGKSQKVEVVTL